MATVYKRQGGSFMFWGCGCSSYPDAECGDLQNALDGEHPREAHVHVLQCVLVQLALPMVLQCTHWQTHGRQTNRQTTVRTYARTFVSMYVVSTTIHYSSATKLLLLCISCNSTRDAFFSTFFSTLFWNHFCTILSLIKMLVHIRVVNCFQPFLLQFFLSNLLFVLYFKSIFSFFVL